MWRSTASATPTAAFVKNADWQNPAHVCVEALTGQLGAEAVGVFDAEAAASRLMGDSIYTNPMMLGYAWQRGWVPLGHAALMRAIELNACRSKTTRPPSSGAAARRTTRRPLPPCWPAVARR